MELIGIVVCGYYEVVNVLSARICCRENVNQDQMALAHNQYNLRSYDQLKRMRTTIYGDHDEVMKVKANAFILESL